MNNEQLVTQLRDLGNAAQSLATAITMLYANLSINIPSVDEQQEQNTNHCGQDAEEEAHVSLNELLGMKVICVGGSAMKCEGCSLDCGNCVKVELVGGDYLCLAEPQQEKLVISFEDDDKEGLGDIMKRIKEGTQVFMDYLDNITKKEQ